MSDVTLSVPFSGTVVDAVSLEPLPGASVVSVSRPTVGVSADGDGYFYADRFMPGEALQVSFVGFEDRFFDAPYTPGGAPMVIELRAGELPGVEVTGLSNLTKLVILLTALTIGDALFSPRR